MNISSDQVDRSEVDRIASELRQNLGKDPNPPQFFDENPLAPPAVTPQFGTLQVQPEPLPPPKPVEPPKPIAESQDTAEDTIAIDHEGNLKLRDD